MYIVFLSEEIKQDLTVTAGTNCNSVLTCDHSCMTSQNGPVCTCHYGYTLQSDGRSCTLLLNAGGKDIDALSRLSNIMECPVH